MSPGSRFLLYILFLSASALVFSIRVSDDNMMCSTDLPPLHRGILITETESLVLNCHICEFRCDSDHSDCTQTNPFMPPVIKTEPWYIRMGLFPSNKTKTEDVSAEVEDEEDEKNRKTNQRESTNARDRLRILSRASEFVRQDTRQAIKKARLRSYNNKDPTLIWSYVASTGEARRIHHEDMGRVQMKKDTLIITRSKRKDEGNYDCYWRGVLRKRWAVTVVPTGGEPFRFRPYTEENTKDRILKDRRLINANIHIFTHWTPWTKCSACVLPRDYISTDKKGESFDEWIKPQQTPYDVGAVKVRIGICYVRVINVGIPTRPVNAPTLARYDEGLPCRSHLLPYVMKTLRAIAYRPSEMEIKRCRSACINPKDHWRVIAKYKINGYEFFNVTHQRATGLEDRVTPFNFKLTNGKFTFPFNGPFNNLLKIFPKKQPKRRVIIGKAGQPVTLICPFSGQRVKPFAWYKLNASFSREVDLIYENPVDFLTIHNQSRGRIRFDSSFNIMIAAMTKEDNEKWVCIHDNKVIGYVYVAYLQTLKAAEKAVFASKLAKVIAPTLIATCLVYVSTLALLKRPEK